MRREYLRLSALLLSQLMLLGFLAPAARAESEQKTGENHTHEYVFVESREPTCTENGYSLYACIDGDDSYLDDYTDPLGHDWDAGHITAEPTTEEEGEISYTCLRCFETVSESIPPLDNDPEQESETESESQTEPESELEPEPDLRGYWNCQSFPILNIGQLPLSLSLPSSAKSGISGKSGLFSLFNAIAFLPVIQM